VSECLQGCTAIAPDRILIIGIRSTSLWITPTDMAKHGRLTLEPIGGSVVTLLPIQGITAGGSLRHGGDMICTRPLA
jgi:hypothetical protein